MPAWLKPCFPEPHSLHYSRLEWWWRIHMRLQRQDWSSTVHCCGQWQWRQVQRAVGVQPECAPPAFFHSWHLAPPGSGHPEHLYPLSSKVPPTSWKWLAFKFPGRFWALYLHCHYNISVSDFSLLLQCFRLLCSRSIFFLLESVLVICVFEKRYNFIYLIYLSALAYSFISPVYMGIYTQIHIHTHIRNNILFLISNFSSFSILYFCLKIVNKSFWTLFIFSKS